MVPNFSPARVLKPGRGFDVGIWQGVEGNQGFDPKSTKSAPRSKIAVPRGELGLAAADNQN